MTRLDGSDRDSYLIPAHCQHILDRDPGALVKYSTPNGRFETLFVCPSTSRQATAHLRPFVAFDGTHTKCSFPHIFLLAMSLDANNSVIILAYVMVPIHNGTYWRTFMTLLREAIPWLASPVNVFISDQEKGFFPSIHHVFSSTVHFHCTWHMGDNIRVGFGKKNVKVFDKLVYATTQMTSSDTWQRLQKRIQSWGSTSELQQTPSSIPMHSFE